MTASCIAKNLLETDDPFDVDAPNIGAYAGPIAFNTDVADILRYAQSLRKRCEQASGGHALLAGVSDAVLNRAFLRIACESMAGEKQVDQVVKQLRRHYRFVL